MPISQEEFEKLKPIGRRRKDKIKVIVSAVIPKSIDEKLVKIQRRENAKSKFANITKSKIIKRLIEEGVRRYGID